MTINRRKIIGIILSFTIAAIILAAMLLRVWDDLLESLQYINALYFFPAIVICIFAWLSRGWRYQQIFSRLEIKVTLLYSTACIYLSQTVNLIVPARLGDLIRIILVRHEYGSTVSQGLSSIVVERVFDIITVAMLGFVSIFFILNIPDWVMPVIAIPLILGAAFFLFLLFVKKVTTTNKYLGMILKMLSEVREASITPASAVILLTVSIGIWLLDTLICLFVSLMFNLDIPFAVVLLAVVIGNLVKAVPITPGGIGTYELSLAAIFEISGISPASATLVAVIDHLIKNGITLIGGVLSIPYFGSWVVPEIMESIKKRFSGGEN